MYALRVHLKALRKAPAERFATTDAFAADVEHYLSGRPVLARPDSRWYRAVKFFSRNKLWTLSAAAVVAALAIGPAVTLWQSHVAHQAASRAEREAQKAKAVQAFLVELFEANTDAQPDPVKARGMTARELLDVGASKLESRFRAMPDVEDAVLTTVINMYNELGLDEEAARLKIRHIEVLRRLYGGDSAEVADEMLSHAEDVDVVQGSAAALAELEAARRILDAQPAAGAEIRGRLLRDTARIRLKLAPAEALRAAEDAVAFHRRLLPNDAGFGASLGYLARARYLLGDYWGAVAAYDEAVADARRHEPDRLEGLITSLIGSADAYVALGRFAEAEAQLRTALGESLRRNGELHVDTVHAETRLGALLRATDRRAEGRRLIESAAAKLGEGAELDSANIVGPVKRNRGMALLVDGRWQEAAPLLAENLALKRSMAAGALLTGALDDQALLDTLTGRFDEARALLQEASATWSEISAGKADPSRGNRFLLHAGQLALAPQRSLSGGPTRRGSVPRRRSRGSKLHPPAHTGQRLRRTSSSCSGAPRSRPAITSRRAPLWRGRSHFDKRTTIRRARGSRRWRRCSVSRRWGAGTALRRTSTPAGRNGSSRFTPRPDRSFDGAARQ